MHFKKEKLNSEKIETTLRAILLKMQSRQLQHCKNQKQIEPKPFVFKLSEILRLYVERLFSFPALELTGEEFMKEVASHSFFKNRYENTLRDFVVQGDIIKYSSELVSEKTTAQLTGTSSSFCQRYHANLLKKKKNGEEPSNLKIGNK